MDSLLPLRADLLRGDVRALYLGWLAAAGREEIEDDEPEPPVAPGLRSLSAPLQSLAEFLDVEPNLLESAAAASADVEVATPPRDLVEEWIRGLPEDEKDALLIKLTMGEDPHLGAGLLRRFQSMIEAPDGTVQARRTAAELRSEAEALVQEQKRREEERKRRRREIEEQRKAAERAKRQKALAAREESVWAEVDELVATKRAKDYDQAAVLLADLRDIAAAAGRSDGFKQRIRGIAERHAAKPAFLRRLLENGLLD